MGVWACSVPDTQGYHDVIAGIADTKNFILAVNTKHEICIPFQQVDHLVPVGMNLLGRPC